MNRKPKALERVDIGLFLRIMVRVKVVDDCWLWQGCKTPEGYGKIKYLYKDYWVHRAVYAFMNGGVRARHHIHHKCLHTDCVNPDHLQESTIKFNVGERNRRWAMAQYEPAPF